MTLLRKFFSTVVFSLVLFVGFCLTTNIAAHAAVTPDEAKGIIQNSDSMMNAGEKLREADSAAKVRGGQALDTAKEVRRGMPGIDAKGGDPLGRTEEKLKDVAENVKEKLNLDEPLAPSTKKFLGKREEVETSNGEVQVKEEPGYYQRNRQTQVYTEEK
jgi:hypothetical protein